MSEAALGVSLVRSLGPVRGAEIIAHVTKQTLRAALSSTAYQSYWTGIVETELFAQTYKSYGLATVRYPVLEIEARVEHFDNGRGFSLRVLRAGKPRRSREHAERLRAQD